MATHHKQPKRCECGKILPGIGRPNKSGKCFKYLGRTYNRENYRKREREK